MRKLFLAALLLAFLQAAAQPKTLTMRYKDGRIEHKSLSAISALSFPEVDYSTDLLQVPLDRTKACNSIYEYHFDFGLPALIIGIEAMGEDFRTPKTGYDHFIYWKEYNTVGSTSVGNAFPWIYFYQNIVECNRSLAELQADIDDPHVQYMTAQLRALRSYYYWWLVQLFAKPCNADPQSPGVVILNSYNWEEISGVYMPRSTVAEVYKYIEDEITATIETLERVGDRPEVHACNLHPKYAISLPAALGLRARYALTSGDYANAAKYARKAIELSNATPLSLDEANRPGFNNIDAHNWLWGIDIHETDRATTSGIINFPSMVCTFVNGYTAAGAYRCCGDKLYEWLKTQNNDVRANWFVDDNYKVNINATPSQRDYVYSLRLKDEGGKFANVKFNSYFSQAGSFTNACDIPLMRIEEMYLIAAESEAMSGSPATACNLLVDFVSKYRNPSFTCAETTPAGVQAAIIDQRRAEFWGEGLRHFDRLRLGLDLDRTGNGFEEEADFIIKGGSTLFQMQIPTIKKLFTTDHNPEREAPVGGSTND